MGLEELRREMSSEKNEQAPHRQTASPPLPPPGHHRTARYAARSIGGMWLPPDSPVAGRSVRSAGAWRVSCSSVVIQFA